MENEMNNYRVETNMEVYGKSIMYVSAHTPYDAAEKATKHMGWRQKDDIKIQEVMILDGSQQTWEFCKHKENEIIPIPGTYEAITICHTCGYEI